MGQALSKHRTVLIVEDDADLRHLTAALLEEGQLDIIESESAEAALAVMLLGEREVAMILANVRLQGAMDGVGSEPAMAAASHSPDLGASARAHPRTAARCRLSAEAVAAAHFLVTAEQALAYARGARS